MTKIKDVLSKKELEEMLTKSDWKGAVEVLFTWGAIILSLLIAGFYPHFITIFAALWIVGGRQLALAILLHDTAHRALFKSKKLNIVIGQWLCAYPILNDAERYRPYHLQHHNHTGTELDPDTPLTIGYPASPKSFTRKILRDLTGISGIKGYIGIFLMHFGIYKFSLGGKVEKEDLTGISRMTIFISGMKKVLGPIAVNLSIFLLLHLLGIGWTYAIWMGALLTTSMFCARIRSIAEHSVVPDKINPLKNTRTTYANWWERMLFAPHFVNYHLEHHLVINVPPYNLPKMHKLLKERGVLNDACMADNYISVITQAIKLG